MHKQTVLFALCLLFTVATAEAGKIAGIEIQDTYTLPGSDSILRLNGAGIREKFFLDIYIGALYLPSTSADVDTILNDNQAASVLMHFLYSEVSKQKITDGWKDGLDDNLGKEQMAALAPRLEKFNSLFRTVHEGDEIRIDYLPESGTNVRINGEWRGAVEGNDFFRALLRIWLGSDPVSKPLKQAMLGAG
ncbi:MAG: chalcone isomerase family protein [Gammaproteobacteria bacterium]|jgi:hypothetical protein